MTTQQLRYFLTLSETLSFSATAEILYVSQSTVSKQIAQIEKELDAVLFERRPHRVELTPAGQAFIPFAHKILGELDTTVNSMNKMTSPDAELKQLDISCDPGFWDDAPLRDLIMDGFRCIQLINPTFNVLYHDLSYGASLDMLKTHRLDLRFVTLPDFVSTDVFGFPGSIELRRLSRDRLGFAVMSDLIRDHAHPLPELEKLNLFIAAQDSRTLAHGLTVCRQLNISPEICFFSQPEQGKLLLHMGKGMLLVSRGTFESFIHPQTPHTVFFEFDVPEATMIRAVLWAKDNENRCVAQFLQELERHIDPI